MPNPPIELDPFTQELVNGPENAYGMSYEDQVHRLHPSYIKTFFPGLKPIK